MIRSGEVEVCVGVRFDVGVLMKLGAVVGGDGLEGLRIALDKLDRAAVQRASRTIFKFSDHDKP